MGPVRASFTSCLKKHGSCPWSAAKPGLSSRTSPVTCVTLNTSGHTKALSARDAKATVSLASVHHHRWHAILAITSLILLTGQQLVKVILFLLVRFDLFLQSLVILTETLELLLVVDDLLKQQVLILVLTLKVNVKLPILLYQVPVLDVEFLCNLRHRLQVLFQSLFLLGRVNDVLLLLALLILQTRSVFVHALVEALPEANLALPQAPLRILLHVLDLLIEVPNESLNGFDLLVVGHILKLRHQLADLWLIVIQLRLTVHIDSIFVQLVMDAVNCDLVIRFLLLLPQRVLILPLDLLFQLSDHTPVLLLSEDVHLLFVDFFLLEQ